MAHDDVSYCVLEGFLFYPGRRHREMRFCLEIIRIICGEHAREAVATLHASHEFRVVLEKGPAMIINIGDG